MTQRHFINFQCLSFTIKNVNYNSVQQIYVENLMSVQHWLDPVEGREKNKRPCDHQSVFSTVTKIRQTGTSWINNKMKVFNKNAVQWICVLDVPNCQKQWYRWRDWRALSGQWGFYEVYTTLQLEGLVCGEKWCPANLRPSMNMAGGQYRNGKLTRRSTECPVSAWSG